MYRSALTQSANVLRRSSVVATPRIASRFAAARPSAGVLGSVASKRSYHEKVIDHYENPRNVSTLVRYVSTSGERGRKGPRGSETISFRRLTKMLTPHSPSPITCFPHQTLTHQIFPQVGSFNKKDLDVGTGLVGAPACGDVMKLQIKVDDNGVIQQAVFKTFGCGSAIASSSYATELIRGMTLDQAAQVTNKTISKELALPPVKLHCSMLAEDAITVALSTRTSQSAIKDYRSKRSKAPSMQPPAASATQQTATA
ncbi:hypothetical protein QFC24_004421 [Naganishia onofrii]|uniref:Uncharacterized protein n=1 Tax=Naganishia onofrii TaxID=1851511 RepID=A0ACC2XFN0_9TREE|nr:hypothetical protein QFC24_004421 [Naganishia onofrii]